MNNQHTNKFKNDEALATIILVPQGAEYNAVCRGLKGVTNLKPAVIPIPIGSNSVSTYLQQCQACKDLLNHPQSQVLVMGLCGSLTRRYKVGDIVLYEDCVRETKHSACDACGGQSHRTFTAQLSSHLQQKVSTTRALTSDRIICNVAEKLHLGEQFQADVVDMEGLAVLEFFRQASVAVAMLRVVSDDCEYNLPDVNKALSPDGSLESFPLALAMLRQPIAATRLIRGSLRGLKVLEQVTKKLFSG